MSGAEADANLARLRLARRVVRLFRIERAGRLERRPATTARHLIARRGVLIASLFAGDEPPRPGDGTAAAALDDALRELAVEVDWCRSAAAQRLADLAAELRLRRGGARVSGMRRDGGGRLLGSG